MRWSPRALLVALAAATAYEWSAVFELDGKYSWTATKMDGAYAAESMAIFVSGTTTGPEEDEACDDVSPFSDVILVPTERCQRLVFDSTVYLSLFVLETTNNATQVVTIHAEHHPDEFADDHFLKDAHGRDVLPLEEDEDHHEHSSSSSSSSSRRPKAWRLSMLASAVVLCCIVVGVFVLQLFGFCGGGGHTTTRTNNNSKDLLITKCMAALASGALLALAAFLVLFEATHLIQARWKEESQAAWRFGTLLVSGFAIGCFSQLFFPHHHYDHHPRAKDDDDAVAQQPDDLDEDRKKAIENTFSEKTTTLQGVNVTLVVSIFTGDFFCNFVDGIVIAQAFLECNASRGWTIAAATVYHELAQELSDFALLVNVAGLGTLAALVVNFVSALGVFLGAAVFMWTKPGAGTQGLLLALGGGVYVFLAATQAAPQFLRGGTSFADRVLIFLAFLVGVVAIGLVLLDHEHCSPDDDNGGDHHGHGH